MRFPSMTADALKAILEKLPPETPVVLAGGSDHTYRAFRRATLNQAGFADGTFYEWFGADSWDDDSPPVDVVVLE
jgi:hypothetical protein